MQWLNLSEFVSVDPTSMLQGENGSFFQKNSARNSLFLWF